MRKSPAVGVGEGVARLVTPVTKEVDDDDISEFIQDGVSYRTPDFTEWGSTPVLVDQAERQGLWKYGALKADTYDLSNKEQLKAYNDLLDKTGPKGAPRVVLVGKPITKFFEGKFFVMAHYHEILYRKLIRK